MSAPAPPPSSPPSGPKRPLRAHEFVDGLALAGRYDFTTAQACEALELSEVAARAAIRRLKKRGVIAAPMRGFHVLVSPEHRVAGCPPAVEFLPQLMAYVEAPYYVGLLSAAAYYGARTSLGAVQVVTDTNRPAVECGTVRVVFVAKHAAASMPTREFATNRGTVAVSTPEVTALDLAAYPQHAGGIDEIASLVRGIAPMLDGEALAVVASTTAEVPSVQRLGYVLDRCGASDATTGPLARYVAEAARYATPLDPRRPWTGVPRDPRWKVAVNTSVPAF